MRSELVEVIIDSVDGSAHLAAITVRYVVKSDREMQICREENGRCRGCSCDGSSTSDNPT
jgi:hypothetical protein